MKILFVNTNIGYGGASKIIVWVANQFAKHNHDVIFYTFRNKSVNQILHPKVTLIQETIEESTGFWGMFKTIFKLHNLINRNKIDIAIAFLSPSQLRLAIASIGTKSKLIFSHRGDPTRLSSSGFKNRIIVKINTLAFNSADAFVFQTVEAKTCFSNKVQLKSKVIANPISPLSRTLIRKGNVLKKIVNVGRLDIIQKRQDLLIHAFNKISNNYPNYVLEFYGDGPDENELREMAMNNPRIHFMGNTNQVAEAIQNASMFILSSDFEGIPNALLEAMSIGVPCISTDCSPGGAALLIKHKENGLLTKRGDIDEIAKSISFYIENPEIAERYGKEGMRVIETFSEDRISSLWLDFINKQLSK